MAQLLVSLKVGYLTAQQHTSHHIIYIVWTPQLYLSDKITRLIPNETLTP